MISASRIDMLNMQSLPDVDFTSQAVFAAAIGAIVYKFFCGLPRWIRHGVS